MTAPYFTNGVASLYLADSRHMPLEDQSVHCCVTSPPYYGLRVYSDNDDRGIGLEQSIDAYLDSLMEVMAEVWRVLRDDGILWVNLGDSYGGSGGAHKPEHANPGLSKSAQRNGVPHTSTLTGGLPANSNHAQEPGTRDNHGGHELDIPHLFRLRMKAAGWIRRGTIIWAKDAPMPESVSGTYWAKHRVKVEANRSITEPAKIGIGDGRRDIPHVETDYKYQDCPGCPTCSPTDGLVLHEGSWRCTRSFEYIFMFTKRMNYWSDGEAVKVVSTYSKSGNKARKHPVDRGADLGNGDLGSSIPWEGSSANRRNVWRDIKPEPYKGQHFATFPPDLPRLCIQASTSEAGACPSCGRQWARVVQHEQGWDGHEYGERALAASGGAISGGTAASTLGSPNGRLVGQTQTLSWRPTCKCPEHKPVRPLVLDCFAGTCTTAVAAQRLGRRSVMVDLSESYLAQGKARLLAEPLPLGV